MTSPPGSSSALHAIDSVMARIPLEPDRGQARSWAVQELSRREYEEARPGLVERALTWLWERLNTLDLGTGAPPLPALLVLLAVLLGVVAYSIHRSGGLARTARRREARVLPDGPVPASDYRSAAAGHAAAGRWDEATVELFRAVARELEERVLLTPRPGRTAREVARDGGARRADLAAGLLAGARAFDDVTYGHLPVGRAAYEALADVDTRLRERAPANVPASGPAQ